MPNISNGINIALQAVLANSRAIETVEHNVANASTEGYRRQQAIFSATTPTYGTGSGVIIKQIQRFNLEFFDNRYRSASAATSNYSAQQSVLAQVEATLGETTANGLVNKLDQFWSDWSGLSNDPSNMALRDNLLDDSRSLAEGISQRWTQLTQLRRDQNLTIEQRVKDVNDLADEVARLNGEISRVISVGEQPNDLLDKRDLALDQLAKLSGATSTLQANNEVVVSIGGHVLVTGNDALHLTTQPNPADTSVSQVVWEADPTHMLNATSGELKGLLEVRDTTIPDLIDGLNQLAVNLRDQVNAIHATGHGIDAADSTGLAFLTGTGASDIAVNAGLTAEQIGLSSATAQNGNGDIANAMLALRDSKVMNGGTNTLNEFYNGQVTRLGQKIKTVETNAYNHNLVSSALGDQRESVAGVNLDEEAASLVQYQRANQAAARIMTAYDELLDLVINGMGVVGR